MLGDSMVHYTQGWNMSIKLDNKHKVYVRSFSSANVKVHEGLFKAMY